MGFNCGIVGLPNVGKSTLFNALTATEAAEAANFPFCTIEPNVGRVAVPDRRLIDISTIAKSAKVIPTQLEFVDIAGLVKGASRGEGLGNQFLANIREVDAIIHVLRCFEDQNVTHVDGIVDPLRDMETIETELMLADLDSLEKRITPLEKLIRGGDRDAKLQMDLVERSLECLKDGFAVRTLKIIDGEQKVLRKLQLLTSKPILYVCNVNEVDAVVGNKFSTEVQEAATRQGTQGVVISAQIEEEVSQLTDEQERADFLKALGIEETGLARVIRAGYQILGLITFFTAGPKETRAWTVSRGAKAPQTAGEIHTDFEKGFIRAETISFDDYVTLGGEHGAKEAGRMRQEGRDYITQDGDIMLFRFNI